MALLTIKRKKVFHEGGRSPMSIACTAPTPMPHYRLLAVLLSAAAVFGGWVSSAEEKWTLEAALERIPQYVEGSEPDVASTIRDAVLAVQTEPKAAAALSHRLIEILRRKDITPAARKFLFQELYLIAQEENVEELVPFLTKPETSDLARYALEQIPGEAVDKALIRALPHSRGKEKLGIVMSLGARKNPAAVDALDSLLKDGVTSTSGASTTASKQGKPSEDLVIPCAVVSLGQLAAVAPEARQALLTAFEKIAGEQQGSTVDVLAPRFVEGLFGSGSGNQAGQSDDGALVLCVRPTLQAYLHVPALRAKTVASASDGLKTLQEYLTADDVNKRMAALQVVQSLPGDINLSPLCDLMPQLDPTLQAGLLYALAERRAPCVESLALAALDSENSLLKVSAASALAAAGTGSHVPDLVSRIVRAKDKTERETLRYTLATYADPETNAVLAKILKNGDAAVAAEAARVAAARRATPLVAELSARAPEKPTKKEDDPEDLWSSCFQAVGILAGPEVIPTLTQRIPRYSESRALPALLSAVERMYSRTERRAGDAEPLLAAYKKTKMPKAKAAVLKSLGAVSDPQTLTVIEAAAKSKQTEIRRAAYDALGAWRDPEPLDLLLGLMQNSADDEKEVGVHNAIRLVRMLESSDAVRVVSTYKTLVTLAPNTNSRRAVLIGMAGMPRVEFLPLIDDLLTRDQDTRKEANMALEQILSRYAAFDASHNAESAPSAYDRSQDTRWVTPGPQTPGQYFQIDLKYPLRLSSVTLDTARSPKEYPRQCALYLSEDGQHWGTPVAETANTEPVVTLTFPPQRARYVKIVQTGQDPTFPWSIYQLRLGFE